MNVIRLQDCSNATIIFPCHATGVMRHPAGRGAARLARLHGVQEVGGSNPLAPTDKETLARESFTLMNWFRSFRADRNILAMYLLTRAAVILQTIFLFGSGRLEHCPYGKKGFQVPLENCW